MTTAPPAPAPVADDVPTSPPPIPLGVVGILSDRSQIDDAMLSAFYAQRNFSLTSTALQRRADRLHMFRDGRAKRHAAEVKRTAKEYDLHQKGEPWASYQVAADAVRAAVDAGEPIPAPALAASLSFAPESVRLYDAHKAAVKAKKDELGGLDVKISAVESALESLLRRGIGARGGDAAQPQVPLPGMGEEAPTPTSWMDQGARQTVYDTLVKEMRVIDVDIAKAANGNDRGAQARAEQDKRQHAELLESLTASGLLDGLTPDDADESPDIEAPTDHGEDDVDFSGASEPELEDATKHPALQGAIAKTASKRQSKRGRGK